MDAVTPTPGEVCGAVRVAAAQVPCPLPPGHDGPHDPDSPWTEVPLREVGHE